MIGGASVVAGEEEEVEGGFGSEGGGGGVGGFEVGAFPEFEAIRGGAVADVPACVVGVGGREGGRLVAC